MSHHRLILYTRPRCHLCDRLEVLVRSHLKALGATLEKRDVDDDPDWEERYGLRIPVVELDGRVILEGKPTAQEAAAAFARLGP